MTSRTLALLVWLAASATACGGRTYAYAPVGTTGAVIAGSAAAELPFPPRSPRGHVRLATLGLANATPESPRSIHLRMVVQNRGPEPWVLDKRDQVLAIALDHGHGPRSTFVRADAARPPDEADRQTVAAGQTATVDLYFPLPPTAQGVQDVPAFDALWTMHTGPAAITTRTPFERFRAATPAQDLPAAASPYGEAPAPTNPTLVPDAVPRAPMP